MNQIGDLICVVESVERSIDYDIMALKQITAQLEKRGDMTIFTKNEEHHEIVFAGKKIIYTPEVYDE